MDTKTRELLMEINPAALAQYNKRERKRAAAQRQLAPIMEFFAANKKPITPPEQPRYISLEEAEFDRRQAFAMKAEKERQAAADAKAAESEKAAARYRAGREAEQAQINESIERNFIREFEAAGQEWR